MPPKPEIVGAAKPRPATVEGAARSRGATATLEKPGMTIINKVAIPGRTSGELQLGAFVPQVDQTDGKSGGSKVDTTGAALQIDGTAAPFAVRSATEKPTSTIPDVKYDPSRQVGVRTRSEQGPQRSDEIKDTRGNY
jgi:hypothetical protein